MILYFKLITKVNPTGSGKHRSKSKKRDYASSFWQNPFSCWCKDFENLNDEFNLEREVVGRVVGGEHCQGDKFGSVSARGENRMGRQDLQMYVSLTQMFTRQAWDMRWYLIQCILQCILQNLWKRGWPKYSQCSAKQIMNTFLQTQTNAIYLNWFRNRFRNIYCIGLCLHYRDVFIIC